MLEVRRLCASYGSSQVLFEVDLDVPSGEVAALIGRNGMGKTSLVRSLLGIEPITRKSGSIRFAGQEVIDWPSHRIARLGVGLVPEGRQVFSLLSVKENLLATAREVRGGWTLERVYQLFPRLAERRSQNATSLSGGEQQMLAIARALMTNPQLLVLDEATEGLAPLAREEIWRTLAQLRDSAISILIIDQAVEKLGGFAHRHYVIEKGRIVASLTAAQLRADTSLVERYLHL